MQFSKQNGFMAELCQDREKVNAKAKSKQWDLILAEFNTNHLENADKLINEINNIQFQYKPAFFIILSKYPESVERLSLYESGCDDIIVLPVLPQEIEAKMSVFFQKKLLEQEMLSKENQLEKSLSYLDKFKEELKLNKEALIDEKNSMNNALKQINNMTLEREKIKKELTGLKTTLKENLQGFGDFLSRLIETRVEKNRGHAVRVAQIADYVGNQLNLSETDLQTLEKAAILHEVGLLLIPEATLKKDSGDRDDWENDFFIQYPVKGADLLNNCSEFEKAAEIIRYLNENSDGTGSPKGLKRRYIPLPSRILAGADMFESIKDNLAVFSLDEFLKTLETFSGSRLDPNIVNCLEKYAVLHFESDSYRVKGIGIHQLKPGMKLGTSLFTETGTKLYSVNTLLTQDAIDKIIRYNRGYPVNETVYIRA